MKNEKADILIVGAGIAGLSMALQLTKLQANLSIVILIKESLENCNTFLAQGGIAAVMDKSADSFDLHAADTLEAGNYLGNKKIIKSVIENAPKRIEELIQWGISFDRHKNEFDLHREGGHSKARILHCKDKTGKVLHQQLVDQLKRNTKANLVEKAMAIDLIVEKDACKGVIYHNASNKMLRLEAEYTVLASGGCGQLFPSTTNAESSTGDGVAMALRAKVKVKVKDLHYIQFHPTALYEPNRQQKKLISEAVRGAGAHVVNPHGERFLFQHDPKGELACRDVVSKAIFHEMKAFKMDYMFLDLRHLDEQKFRKNFPEMLYTCRLAGINPFKECIPIAPAAHYQCGGIEVNSSGQTSLKKLYAIGECAATGLHGNNRLASNSLLEAAEFAHRASVSIVKTKLFNTHAEIDEKPTSSLCCKLTSEKETALNELRDQLQETLLIGYQSTEKQALVEQQVVLEQLQKSLDELKESNSKQFFEMRNLIAFGISLLAHKLGEEQSFPIAHG